MTSIWRYRLVKLGSEKSHYVHGWIVVCQKPSVLCWRIHTDCLRLEAITGGGGGVLVCVCVFCVVLCCFDLFCFVLFCFVLFCFVLFRFPLLCFALFCFVFVLFRVLFVCLFVCFFLLVFVCLFVCLFFFSFWFLFVRLFGLFACNQFVTCFFACVYLCFVIPQYLIYLSNHFWYQDRALQLLCEVMYWSPLFTFNAQCALWHTWNWQKKNDMWRPMRINYISFDLYRLFLHKCFAG